MGSYQLCISVRRFELLPQIIFKMIKALVGLALVAAAAGIPAGPPPPAPYHAPAPAYKPAPYGKAPEKLPPQPFAYEYGVKDGYSGADFAKNENQDASEMLLDLTLSTFPTVVSKLSPTPLITTTVM